MPDGRERFTQIRPAATLLLSVNCLYQMNEKNCKGEFEKCMGLAGEGIPWRRMARLRAAGIPVDVESAPSDSIPLRRDLENDARTRGGTIQITGGVLNQG